MKEKRVNVEIAPPPCCESEKGLKGEGGDRER